MSARATLTWDLVEIGKTLVTDDLLAGIDRGETVEIRFDPNTEHRLDPEIITMTKGQFLCEASLLTVRFQSVRSRVQSR